MLTRTLRSAWSCLPLLLVLAFAPLAVAGGRGKVRGSVPMTQESKPTKVTGAISNLDLKKRTCVIVEHHEGGRPDKAIMLSWSRGLRPKQGDKEVDWRQVRPGMLATVQYVAGKDKDHSHATEVVLAK